MLSFRASRELGRRVSGKLLQRVRTPPLWGQALFRLCSTLRLYQKECIETCLRELRLNNRRRQLVSLPVGSGKTVIFANLIKQLPSPPEKPNARKTLVLAHREELLDQAMKVIKRVNPELRVEIERGSLTVDKSDLANTDVVVASVPTLGRADSPRLSKFDPSEFKAIIIDEAHHVPAPTYLRILDYFGCGSLLKYSEQSSHILVWGCSATCSRHDGIGLHVIFPPPLVYHRGLQEMIEEGWLCRLRSIRVATVDTDLSTVDVLGGDYSVSQLARTVNNPRRNAMIVDTWKTLAAQNGRKSTLVFAADVQHISDLLTAFRSAGIDARGISGDTAGDERTRLVNGFRRREFPVLVNCGVLTEGVDMPTTDCIIMARPTLSSVLFQQMIGRGLRRYPEGGKTDLLVVDMVDNHARNELVTVPTLFGLSPFFNMAGDDVVSTVREMERLMQTNITARHATSLAQARELCFTELDVLTSARGGAEAIPGNSRYVWQQLQPGHFFVPLGAFRKRQALLSVYRQAVICDAHVDNGVEYFPFVAELAYLTCSKDIATSGPAGVDSGDADEAAEGRLVVARGNDWRNVFARAEEYLREHFAEQLSWVERNATWRKGPASHKQLQYLKNLQMGFQLAGGYRAKDRAFEFAVDDDVDNVDEEEDEQGEQDEVFNEGALSEPVTAQFGGQTLSRGDVAFLITKHKLEKFFNYKKRRNSDSRIAVVAEDAVPVESGCRYAWLRMVNATHNKLVRYLLPLSLQEDYRYVELFRSSAGGDYVVRLIRRNKLKSSQASIISPEQITGSGRRRRRSTNDGPLLTLDQAIAFAEQYIDKHYPRNSTVNLFAREQLSGKRAETDLVQPQIMGNAASGNEITQIAAPQRAAQRTAGTSRNNSWKNHAATAAQRQFLERLGVPDAEKEDLTKGEAARLIAKAIHTASPQKLQR